jgi:acyl-[acyl-carrier-protein]-phospholipid O-acyltransferase/long-chain-fatty-acid--[acyl-carrier-protein] ligase
LTPCHKLDNLRELVTTIDEPLFRWGLVVVDALPPVLGEAPTGFGSGLFWPVLAVAAGLALVAFLYLCWFHPFVPLRWLVWLITHTFYRIRVYGQKHIPATGPALLVCNHVSYIDWVFLVAVQRRFIRFVIFAGWTKKWGLRHLLKWARVIPIDGDVVGPRAIVQALRSASDALAAGELVCIFAEGALTRSGFMLPFHRGFEQIVKRCPAPIIPVCLDQVWGSIFSYHGGKVIWKWPQELPYPVSISFGAPLPATTTAAEVRLTIQKMSADIALSRSNRRLPVHRQFVRMAARHPFKRCFIDTMRNGLVLNQAKSLAGAMCLARRLRPLLSDAPMVGVWLPPGVGAAVANIALALLGKASVNLNYTSPPDSVQSAIRQCNLRHVLTSILFLKRLHLDPGPGVELVHLEDFRKQITKWQLLRAYLSVVLLPGWVLDRWVLGLGKHGPDDLATVIFSSGSTGEPKGVMLTHRNIAANAQSMVQVIDLRSSDRLLGVLPFFHSFGYTVTLWCPLQVAASAVYHIDPRQAKEIGELCRTYRCTIFLSTATFLRFCLRRCEDNDFRSLRVLVCGAEKLPSPLAQEFEKKFGVLPMEGYGCTELSPAVATNIPDKEISGVRQVCNKISTIGQPLPGVAARVVDPDSYEPLPPGQEGLLLIYGANVMKGYLGRDDLTRLVIRDGWYVTGDMAKIDPDGFITITGRLTRFAKIGGEMVPLEKIEEDLHDVLQTSARVVAVASVPDERKGERLIVLHLPLNGTEPRLLSQRLSEKGLPNLWIPGERDFFLVPEMPVLGSGKLDLKRVKEMALERAKGDAV